MTELPWTQAQAFVVIGTVLSILARYLPHQPMPATYADTIDPGNARVDAVIWRSLAVAALVATAAIAHYAGAF